MIPFFLAIHVLAAVIWVGGMFFALMILRPAALPLAMEQRVDLWFRVVSRFFFWIWLTVAALPLSGYILAFMIFGGLNQIGQHVLIMQAMGWTMIALFVFAFFIFYRRMGRMVENRLIPEAGIYMNRIRIVISINLILGISTVIFATTGRFL